MKRRNFLKTVGLTFSAVSIKEYLASKPGRVHGIIRRIAKINNL